jgi:hypothetical protein
MRRDTILSAVALAVMIAAVSHAEDPVYFADANLKAALEAALGVTSDANYTREANFVKDVVTPFVTTLSATDVGGTYANLWGRIDDDGGEACTVYFEYMKSGDTNTKKTRNRSRICITAAKTGRLLVGSGR